MAVFRTCDSGGGAGNPKGNSWSFPSDTQVAPGRVGQLGKSALPTTLGKGGGYFRSIYWKWKGKLPLKREVENSPMHLCLRAAGWWEQQAGGAWPPLSILQESKARGLDASLLNALLGE